MFCGRRLFFRRETPVWNVHKSLSLEQRVAPNDIYTSYRVRFVDLRAAGKTFSSGGSALDALARLSTSRTCPCASCGGMCETIINKVVDIDSTATPSCTRFAGCYWSRCWSAPDIFGSIVYQEPRTINQVDKHLLLVVTMVRAYGPDGSLVLALVYICKIRCVSTIDEKGEC